MSFLRKDFRDMFYLPFSELENIYAAIKLFKYSVELVSKSNFEYLGQSSGKCIEDFEIIDINAKLNLDLIISRSYFQKKQSNLL